MYEVFVKVCAVLGGVLGLVSFAPYILAIYRRTFTPPLVTWLIWSTGNVISVVTMHLKGSLNPQIVGSMFGAFVVVALLLRDREKLTWSLLDLLCGGVAVAGLIVGIVQRDPFISLCGSQAASFMGSLRVISHGLKFPHEENRMAWKLYAASCVFTILSISEWSWAAAIQPFNFAFLAATMIYVVWIRPYPAPT